MLIVDDELSVVETLQEFFRQFQHGHEYDVEATLNGADALVALRRARPDIVLLDLHMPEMDGLTLLRHIQERDRTIPVVMVTANRDPHAAGEAHSAGVFAYVPKPFDLKYLDVVVALAVSGTVASRSTRAPSVRPLPGR